MLNEIIEQLEQCNERDLRDVLDEQVGCNDDSLAFAGSLLVCAHRRGITKPNWFDTCFELLGESDSPVALRFLVQAATHARVAETRIEAIRNLRGKDLEASALDLVHRYARNGSPEDAKIYTFKRGQDSDEYYQAAAVEVLSAPESRNDESLKVVWDVFRDAMPSWESDKKVYEAGLATLSQIQDSQMVEWVLDELQEGWKAPCAMDLLSILGNQTMEDIDKEKDQIQNVMFESLKKLKRYQNSGSRRRGGKYEEREGTLNLMKRIMDGPYLKRLYTEFPGINFGSDAGKIVSAGLEAYEKADNILPEACLTWIEEGGNSNVNGSCFGGLRRCADLFPEDIIGRLCDSEESTMRSTCMPSTLLTVFGDFESILGSGLSALENDKLNDTEQLGLVCLASCLPAPKSIDDPRKKRTVSKLQRNMVRQTREWTEDIRQQFYDLCDEHDCWDRCETVVKRVLAPDMQRRTAELLAGPLSKDDDLGRQFTRIAVRVMIEYAEDPEYPGKNVSCLQVEEWIGEHFEKVANQIIEDELMSVDGGSRYLVRLMHLQDMDFVERGQKLIQSSVHSAGEKIAVIEEVEKTGDRAATDVLVEALGYTGDGQSQVRTRALQAVGAIWKCEGRREPVPDDCLHAVLRRFHDCSEVRQGAYRACKELVSYNSIERLKKRLEVEPEESKERDELGEALGAIAERLKAEKPPPIESSAIKKWLMHVGTLGNADLFDEVVSYLLPNPHDDPDIAKAALECLAELGDERGIDVCKKYLEEIRPSSGCRHAAQRAIIELEDRGDRRLLEYAPWLIGEESDLCDPSKHNYEDLFGAKRCDAMADQLMHCPDLYDREDWDTLVARLDNVGHQLLKQLYLSCWEAMGLTQEKGKILARSTQGSVLGKNELKNTYPRIQSALSHLHSLRGDSNAPHAESEDHEPKEGIQDQGPADTAIGLLREAFELSIQALEEQEVQAES